MFSSVAWSAWHSRFLFGFSPLFIDGVSQNYNTQHHKTNIQYSTAHYRHGCISLRPACPTQNSDAFNDILTSVPSMLSCHDQPQAPENVTDRYLHNANTSHLVRIGIFDTNSGTISDQKKLSLHIKDEVILIDLQPRSTNRTLTR